MAMRKPKPPPSFKIHSKESLVVTHPSGVRLEIVCGEPSSQKNSFGYMYQLKAFDVKGIELGEIYAGAWPGGSGSGDGLSCIEYTLRKWLGELSYWDDFCDEIVYRSGNNDFGDMGRLHDPDQLDMPTTISLDGSYK